MVQTTTYVPQGSTRAGTFRLHTEGGIHENNARWRAPLHHAKRKCWWALEDVDVLYVLCCPNLVHRRNVRIGDIIDADMVSELTVAYPIREEVDEEQTRQQRVAAGVQSRPWTTPRELDPL